MDQGLKRRTGNRRRGTRNFGDLRKCLHTMYCMKTCTHVLCMLHGFMYRSSEKLLSNRNYYPVEKGKGPNKAWDPLINLSLSGALPVSRGNQRNRRLSFFHSFSSHNKSLYFCFLLIYQLLNRFDWKIIKA